jgi:RNA polymerase sigma-70 factor (sigma-E family)
MAIEDVSGNTPAAWPALRYTRVDDRAHEQEFVDVVATHHERLARLAFLLCSSREQAEDAVAEAYAKVWPRYRRGQVRDPVGYLRQAVVNQVRGGLRRRVLERREEQRQRAEGRATPTPEHAVEARHVLEPALARLSPGQRAVIVLRFYEDLSEEETAALLGIRVGTVKSRCARALDQLRALVGETDG